jgi:Bacterial Ig domain
MNIPFQYITRLFVAAIVAVSPAFIFAQSVVAVDDIAHTTKNKPVTIDPLANDKGTGLYIDDIVLVNHGKASIVNGKIEFTPDADFKGAGLINYTTCNALKECSCGLVIVDINEAILPVYQEMKIFVAGTTTTKFTLPAVFTEVPQSSIGTGTIAKDNSTGEWLYQATEGFRGATRRMFETTDVDNIRKRYEVEFEVLPTPPQYAVPDLFATRPGQKVNFNVFKNDIGGRSTVSFGTCVGGSITTSTDGNVEFTPSVGEGGKATFNYTITADNGKKETATVTIFVSNYLPAKEQYQLQCSGVPLVISYPAPIDSFEFKVVAGGYGTVKYYPTLDAFISNQRVTGKNVLLYTPNLNNLRDVFFVKYCVGNICSDPIEIRVQIEETATGDQCFTNCVWPGDMNGDGNVNMMDLYPIAQNMGQRGKARFQDTSNNNYQTLKNQWYPHTSPDWGKESFG